MSDTTIQVLVVPADGGDDPSVVRITRDDTEWYQATVGGWLEAISGDGWTGYCNEEGKLHNLAPNTRATQLANVGGWRAAGRDFLVGPVVFMGVPTIDGYETDVPESLLWLMRRIG